MEADPTLSDLTCRETAVLRLLAQGLPNRLIARRLEISEKTVRNHLSSVYLKIGAADRTQAALFAQRMGLTEPRDTERSATPSLTAREAGVLRLVARGFTNRLIARRLEISEKTVKNHLSGIYLKIGAAGRTQAALYAQSMDLAV
ncbi:DNA-binding NarL/FixJ family response regulator [Streptomyces sp. V3I8]|jgi:DNA-binding NarL/FixJ family response regulator|uniref:helix-turn-helix domain-containing protein n=1 Tax=Streptomyces sp. V3I8 TaxID=3042279 RepID=UPI002789A62C|nr:LuxR C-terminal-related transcriptional regulator [Streptomyces sp. V3I8]MDQ1034636.1 DNA-binding NarL/FixJ family response regulator [Streptomyces sp. V3I8]